MMKSRAMKLSRILSRRESCSTLNKPHPRASATPARATGRIGSRNLTATVSITTRVRLVNQRLLLLSSRGRRGAMISQRATSSRTAAKTERRMVCSICIQRPLFAPVTQVLKTGMLAEKGQADGADRAVSLFADDQFGVALVPLGARAVPFATLLAVDRLAVDEHDHVGILLDGAGFAQVAHHRALVGAFFQLTVELGESHYRHTQLLGQRLQGLGDLRNLLLPRFDAGTRLHQLQIVDDDQPDIMLALQAPCLGAQLQNADGR